MVGSAIVRRLHAIQDVDHGVSVITRGRHETDLRDQRAVLNLFESAKPDVVILAAAKVGGIYANSTFPADFIYDNLAIQCNVIHSAWKFGVQRLLFLGSSCIYPRLADQPIREDSLLTGPLEPTNEPYAVAKIAGIKLCESYNRQHGTDFRCVMPTNLYGPGDNYHPNNSHVVPALIRRFHAATVSGAPEVAVWGSGSPRREFLHVDDLADAAMFVLNLPKPVYASSTSPMRSHINVGTGVDISIRTLAEMIADISGFRGRITFDSTKPDGAPRKLLDVSLLASLGWQARISLADGLRTTFRAFLESGNKRGDD